MYDEAVFNDYASLWENLDPNSLVCPYCGTTYFRAESFAEPIISFESGSAWHVVKYRCREGHEWYANLKFKLDRVELQPITE